MLRYRVLALTMLGSASLIAAATAQTTTQSPSQGPRQPSADRTATTAKTSTATTSTTPATHTQAAGVLRPAAPAAPLAPAVPQPQDFTLILGEQAFDLALGDPDVPQAWRTTRNDDNAGDNLHLVQFDRPIQQRFLDQLNNAGFQVVQYIHPFTYVIWGDAGVGGAQRDNLLNQVEHVRATGPFLPAYKVLPAYRELGNDRAVDAAARPVEVDVLLVRTGGEAATNLAAAELQALGAQITGRAPLNQIFEHLTMLVPGAGGVGATFQAMAQIPAVYSIQPTPTDGGLRGEMSNQINVGNYTAAAGSVPTGSGGVAFPGYMNYLNSVGLTGQGVIIANVDGGIQDTHPSLAARLIPCTGSSCGGTASSAHGTHTAGIMAADNTSGVMANGFARGMGVAPGASLVEQVYSPTYTQAGGMLLLMTHSYANGALLSGNSWGPSGSPLGYDNHTMQVDIGVRDTHANTPGDQPLTFVLSIMNGNGGTGTQGTPDDAKNIFTIGSTKMQNTNLSQIQAINDVSANSAHGPARDGRKIPHAVAPGCYVDSTTSGSSHTTMCGTSMASPHVSGAVALFAQYYRNLPEYEVDPSPALVKAAFLPVCYDLAGNVDADGGVLGHPFDSKQGWGRMNLDAVINPPPFSVRYFDQSPERTFDNTGEEWTVSLSPLDSTKPMKMMLVWTDAPGHGLGGATPAWNNNLDLVVETSGGTYRGNVFGPNGYSATGGSPDDRNNTEGVFLPPGAGPVTIRVVAANIASNGVPNAGDSTDQDFALVVYNAALEPGFSISVSPSSSTLCAPASLDITVNIAQILGFTDPVTLSANLPAGISGGFSVNPVVPPGSSTLSLVIAANAPSGEHTFGIVGTSGSIVRQANVTLHLSNAIPPAVSLVSPGNGAGDVPVVPTLVWSAAPQASAYQVQVATDASFANVVYNAVTDETSHTVGSPLETDSDYWWRVRASNVCGAGEYSGGWSFHTLDVPPILLVDDDDNSPDVLGRYTAALNSLGLLYDVWNTNNSVNEPSLQALAPYRVVIWFSGDAFGGTSAPRSGPKAASEAALAQHMNSGACVFLSAQDYLYDMIGSGSTTPNSFMQTYFGMAAPIDHDVAVTNVTGANVLAGFGPYSLAYSAGSGGPGVSNFSDMVNPNANAQTAFTYTGGGTAVSRDGGDYRNLYLAFPFETINDTAQRAAILSTFLAWCGKLNQPCPADITGDGLINVNDLLAVINAWGPCGSPCPADCAPEGGDGQVNVNDLLAVINNWGECP